MKKGICIFLSVLLLGSLLACAPDTTETESPSSQTTGSDFSSVPYESLVAEIDNLKQQVNSMRTRMLDAQGALVQCENYHRTNWWDYELLELAAASDQSIDKFYALIRDIERANDSNDFIFTVDKVERYPEDARPDPDRGFFNNPDESTERLSASRKVIVNRRGYATFEDKENDLLSKENDNRLYNVYFEFFTIDDNIVCFIEYGP